ncbi:hypothetical protein [Streptomyces sp. P17]|jgi:hypothetical protein|uniref:hypothetical protein n=1 Tax=Streptomyces sp. P17 TaxID=3074716 RepID=UPI00259EA637|nr:hypothetical protein [Streptomyces sp. P17]MDG4868733.1 hypothetical protein [Guyparkeria sp. 1SP6A2]MDM7320460.1 hypothetical protein [Fervidobacterium sp.]MDT9700930.1 hypothetical protein [Streptomyces sp. P17]
MINVEINGKLVGQCESAGKASSPLFKDVIEPWIEIRGFIASSPSLTDDQLVVLEWLKKKMTITDIEPIELIWRLRVNSTKEGYRDMPVYKSYRYMTKAGQFQVLAAFAEWGSKGGNQ